MYADSCWREDEEGEEGGGADFSMKNGACGAGGAAACGGRHASESFVTFRLLFIPPQRQGEPK